MQIFYSYFITLLFKLIILKYNSLHRLSFYTLNLPETRYMYKCYEHHLYIIAGF